MTLDFPESNIRAAHQIGTRLLQNAGLIAESIEVALAVEKHRWAWKPEKVRLVLIAESHVYTTPDDLRIKIIKSWLPALAQHTPSEFVRLVYCLGYGESEILSAYPNPKNDIGTWQYWDIFGRLCGRGKQPRKKETTSTLHKSTLPSQ